MSRVRTHLLLPPLETPTAPTYRTDTAALRNADALYRQLLERGYSEEDADRLSNVGRLNGAAVTYNQPEDACPVCGDHLGETPLCPSCDQSNGVAL